MDRATLAAEEGRAESALSDLNRAVELSAGSSGSRGRTPAPAVVARGGVLAAFERFEEALKDYERARSLGGNTSEIRWGQAMALIGLRRSDEALRVVDDMVRDSSRPGDDWPRKAWALKMLGRVEDAAAAADKAVEANPNDGWAYETRLQVDVFLPGRCKSVAADFRKAFDLAPEDVSLGGWLAYRAGAFVARACPEGWDAPLALRLAERAVRSDPRDSLYQKALAFVAYRQGNLARAREAAEEALRRTKPPGFEDPEDFFLLAMIHSKTGNGAKPREEYEKGLKRMQSTRPADPVNETLRDEAASVMGTATR